MKTDQKDKPDFAVFCRVAKDEWRKVIHQNDEGVRVLPKLFRFEDIWKVDVSLSGEDLSGDSAMIQWAHLQNSLSDLSVDTWGYAMTYPSHREEVKLEDSFFFRKHGTAVSANSDIVFRPYLDYEAEIGLLMQRDNSRRFGYILVNDWTDRGIQVETHDKDNMAPGFTKAKSFKDALHVGSLVVIGNESVWDRLEVELRVNGENRQHLVAKHCLIRPEQVFNEIFNEKGAGEWVFVATGTTGGIQFQSPTIWQKLILILSSGFSKKRAGKRWLTQLSFLQPGDKVEFHSALLGRNVAMVIK